MSSEFDGKWEQRWHPLRREWVVYSAHRNSRPWSGAKEKKSQSDMAYDPKCYLCPGNKRIHGDTNPQYEDVFVFDNDHPVVGDHSPEIGGDEGLYKRRSRADGLARVVCYDPRHHVSLSDVSIENMAKVVDVWSKQTREFLENPKLKFALIFENKGEIVGVSSLHPHCQIYATNFVFNNVERELNAVEAFKTDHNKNLFDVMLGAEIDEGLRIVAQNEHAVAMIPYFARYSYEVWLFPKKRHANLSTLSDEEINGIAEVYRELNRRFDLMYDMSFPYVMSLYQSPLDGGNYSDYHLHFVFLPPLRQPGLKKFPAGPEIGGGNFMTDTIPEEKAKELQDVDLDAFVPLT